VSDPSFPTPAAQFLVQVDGKDIGYFSEVSGLSVQVEVVEIPEGGQNQYVEKRPGRMSWPNIVLKRGVTKQNNLFPWMQKSSGTAFSAADNKLERNTAAIIMIDTENTAIRTWNVAGAFPVRWSGPSFSLSASDIATEELEIAHHGFTIS
jgi:phage tail-like protein